MIDYLYLGPVPSDEDCAQVGSDNFHEECRKQLEIYIEQLYRMYPEVTNYKTMKFKQHWQKHDFGSYGEVIITYNDEIEEEESLALKIEWNLPNNWDEEAIKELNLANNGGK